MTFCRTVPCVYLHFILMDIKYPARLRPLYINEYCKDFSNCRFFMDLGDVKELVSVMGKQWKDYGHI